ncbi:MAG TPA: porin [Ramlibacter sp.]|uniref:porin n=1 Tax=Ramlibacter sp. TaxID=1917967 RepID=UPI002CD825C9|nr:porin [Ramlibacter sp.]HVZ45912.1 porin [Ramlibacter sp.]
MKLRLTAVCAALASAPAFAQSSSVTLYGVVDVGLTHASGSVSSVTAMNSNRNASSRLGFRGSEDLGGGLSASFTLEGDVLVDSGSGVTTPLPGWASTTNTTGGASGGFQFNRIATVGLAGGFGELSLGRNYTPTFLVDATYDPFTSNGVGFSLISGTGVFYTAVGSVNHLRASNLISYVTPKFGGFAATLAYAPSEAQSTAPKDGSYTGLRLSYAKGPANADFAMGKTTLAAVGDLRTTSFGASYDFGVVKPMFEYSEDKQGAAGANGRKKGYVLGAWVPAGPGQVRFQWGRVTRTSDIAAEGKVSQVALGYVYNLSKRTAIIATVTRVKNSNYVNGPGAGYQVGGVATSPNSSVNAQDIGIRHIF